MPVTGFYALAVIAVIGVVGPTAQRLLGGANEKRSKMNSSLESRHATAGYSTARDGQSKAH